MRHLLTRVFGSRNERIVRGHGHAVRAANQLEPQIKELSDEALRHKTEEFRTRLKAGETLDDVLPELELVVTPELDELELPPEYCWPSCCRICWIC